MRNDAGIGRHDRLAGRGTASAAAAGAAAPRAAGSASGIQTISAETKIKRVHAEVDEPVARARRRRQSGTCVTITTRLNRIVAGRNRREEPHARASSHGGDSSQRAIQVGVPISSSGAAMIEYVRCCTMCTREQVALAEVVDRPVGGDEDREQPGREATRSGSRVTTGVPAWREPRTDPDDRDRVRRRRATPTSSHTSGWGSHAGNGWRQARVATTSARCSRSVSSTTPYTTPRQQDADDEHAPEERLVHPHVHVPASTRGRTSRTPAPRASRSAGCC